MAEQGVAVLAAEADDVFGQVRPYVERAATCFGMGADDGVGDVFGRVLRFDVVAMHGAHSLEAGFASVVERFVGSGAIAPLGLAAF